MTAEILHEHLFAYALGIDMMAQANQRERQLAGIKTRQNRAIQ